MRASRDYPPELLDHLEQVVCRLLVARELVDQSALQALLRERIVRRAESRQPLVELLCGPLRLDPDALDALVAEAERTPLSCARCGRSFALEELAARGGGLVCAVCGERCGTRVLPAEQRLGHSSQRPALARLGRYEVIRELGRGGMGVVYEALDRTLDCRVALKVLEADHDEALARLQREARLAARLDHPHIISIRQIGTELDPEGGEPVHFIAMEYVEGTTLAGRLCQLEPAEALRIFEEVVSAVAHAHRESVIHRDLKPENVLLDRRDRAIVADFGLARSTAEERDLTRSGTLLGTTRYMAPEQVLGQVDRIGPPADVWALGVMLYELLTGVFPFDGDTPAEIHQEILRAEPAPPRALDPELPRSLELICLEALRREPARRYPDAGALLADLQARREGGSLRARPPALTWRVARQVRRHPGSTAGAVLLLLLGFAGGLAWRAVSGARRQAARQREQDEQRVLRARQEIERYRAVQRRIAPIVRTVEQTRSLFHVAHADLPRELARLRRTLDELHRIAADPRHAGYAEIWSLLGMGRLLAGDPRGAEAACRKALALAPRDGRAAWTLGRVLLERAAELAVSPLDGDEPQVRQWLDAALQALRTPADRDWEAVPEIEREVAAAHRLHLEGRLDELRRRCRAGIVRHGKQLGAEEYWYLLGAAEQGGARIEAWREALRLRPHFPLVRLLLATERLRLEDHRGAIAEVEAALAVRPGWAALYNKRGAARKLGGDPRGALADFSAALALDPGFDAARYNRGFTRREQGDLRGAIEDLSAVLARRPALAVAYNTRGYAYHQLRRPELARADFDRALARDPRLELAWVNRGQLALEQRRFAEAARDFGQAARLAPRRADHHFNLGLARLGLGDRARAAADFDRAIALDPLHAAALTNRATLRMNAGKLELALADLTAAIRSGKAGWQAWANLGLIHLRQRRRLEARAALREARSRAPREAWARLDELIERLGR